MAQVKTLQFPNTPQGQAQKVRVLQRETAQGWRIVSETIIPGKFRGGQACCLFLIFAPCAFLAGHSDDIISVTLQRDGDDSGTAPHVEYDRKKWAALLKYDPDVAAAALQLKALDQKWTDELASAYLALNDKQYLPGILARVQEHADLEQKEIALRRQKEQNRLKAEQDARSKSEQERRDRRASIYNTLFGTREKKIWAIAIVSAALFLLFALSYHALSAPAASLQSPSADQSPAPVNASLPAISPSFDCARIHSQVLKLICNTRDLAQADQDLAGAYRVALSATQDRSDLRRSQRAWIARRNNSSPDQITLQSMYEARIAYLKSVAR